MAKITINGVTLDPEHETATLAAHGQDSPDVTQSNYILVQTSRPVGRAERDADGHEGQQRRDQVGAGVRRLGEQAEAVGRDPGQELDRDQDAGGDDRDERGAALGAHDAEGSHNAEGPLSRALRGAT